MKMRILIYGLQSSGASVFCLWLSQLKNYLGIIDLYVREYAPFKKNLSNENAILKSTTSDIKLAKQIKRFQPDKKILFIRDPYQNYTSLLNKSFKDIGGGLNKKFKRMETIFKNREIFDAVIKYEDFIENKEKVIKSLNDIGIPVSKDNYNFKKSPEDIIKLNCSNSEFLAKTYKKIWDIGNIHQKEGKISLKVNKYEIPEKIKKKVDKLCPNLVEFYKNK